MTDENYCFPFVMVGLIAVVLYLNPQAVHLMCSILLYMRRIHRNQILHLFFSKLKEPTQPKNVSLNQPPQSVSADTVPFYDTKSDPSIQPIDPEKDPANEIKAK
jgi:hypothetical protein